ncbi:MAG: sensor histidine kinase [Gammaproteobacteria bacterium]|nr:sensor histidine kinase [Gammaproteobacteria bacterium]
MITKRAPHTWSIRRRVLGWLLAGMALVFSANLISSYYGNREAADSAYDRLLLASASAIAERMAVREKGLWVDIPYAALNMLASTAQDRVFYGISAPDGTVVTGYEDLPSPPSSAHVVNPSKPLFYDAVYKGAPVRVVSLRAFVIGNTLSGFASIRVAQTRGEREALALSLLKQSAIWTLVIAVSGGIAVWLGISRGLRPLDRLGEALGRRSPDDVRPVLHDVPAEFKPLVAAINSMLMRIDDGISAMRRFISDASHQLKTPLAGLQVQTEMALREKDPDNILDSLDKINVSVKRTGRLAKQLLSHARAVEPSRGFKGVDLARMARETVSLMTPQALSRGIDLGYEGVDTAIVSGDATLLGEMIMNLIDNALRYPPRGALVTLTVTSGENPVLTVDDSGPGIPPDNRKEVFERFVRLQDTPQEGCGLGLAIVQEIGTAHHARVSLEDSPSGGLRVLIEFPHAEKSVS